MILEVVGRKKGKAQFMGGIVTLFGPESMLNHLPGFLEASVLAFAICRGHVTGRQAAS